MTIRSKGHSARLAVNLNSITESLENSGTYPRREQTNDEDQDIETPTARTTATWAGLKDEGLIFYSRKRRIRSVVTKFV